MKHDIYRHPTTCGNPLQGDEHVGTVIGSDGVREAVACYAKSAGVGGWAAPDAGGAPDRWWGGDGYIYRAEARGTGPLAPHQNG